MIAVSALGRPAGHRSGEELMHIGRRPPGPPRSTRHRRRPLHARTGRLTDDVRSLKPVKALRLDVFTEAQNALHIPVPVSFPTP